MLGLPVTDLIPLARRLLDERIDDAAEVAVTLVEEAEEGYRTTTDIRYLDLGVLASLALLRLGGESPEYLDPYGFFLHSRYTRLSHDSDLAEARKTLQASRDGTPLGHHRLPNRLSVLGLCELEYYKRYGRHDDLERAIAHFEEALEAPRSPGADHASYRNNLGLALRHRFLLHGRRPDIDQSIASLTKSVALSAPEDFFLASRHDNLAASYCQRYEFFGNRADLDAAIDAGTRAEALAGVRGGSFSVFNNLAKSYSLMYEATRTLSHIDQAMEYYRAALDLAAEGSADRAMALQNIGSKLVVRFRHLRHVEDINQSVAYLEAAVALTDRASSEHAGRLNDLAMALASRHAALESEEDLERAHSLLTAAVGQAHSPTPLKAGWLNNMGSLLMSRPGTMNAALQCFQEAVAMSGESPDQTRYALNVGLALGHRDRPGVTGPDRAEAMRVYTRICLPSPDPSVRMSAAHRLGDLILSEDSSPGRYREAARQYEVGVAASRELASTQRDFGHGIAWVREAQGLAVKCAAAYASLTDADACNRAVEVLEYGRQMLTEEAVASYLAAPRDAGHPEVEFGTDSPSAAQICSGIRHLTIYLLATARGGIALVLRPGQAPRPLPLDGLKESEVRTQLVRHFGDIHRIDHSGTPRLRGLCSWMWKTVMSEITKVTPQGERVVLVPCGLLALLPWHAAESDTGQDGAAAHATFTVAPSARPPATVFSGPTAGGILAVADPRPSSAPALPFALLELEEVLRTYPPPHVRLPGEKASRKAVLEEVTNSGVIHLACHASVYADVPLESPLALAHDEPITVADILGLKLDNHPGVILSACWTALVNPEVADETISHGTAWLSAGARFVIGSLWPVFDRSTALLMACFYQEWLPDAHPAYALKAAQQWLREATNAELAERFPRLASVPEFGSPAARGFWRTATPYSEPYYWAGFVYTGHE
ncbi:CHAT domain-containing tetratricopeptide repeat protein [Streptomyces sp. ActVer]|uniref:CHAT domain-containing protein n=1 Tax=Streptomyces sp. ActVer TaxID=3014558 RepID=UPI0022B4DC83|nr:CHAT domain-containing tetratricopeptide repeat protein [Streptomyces sp. ActVer]MCZ4510743.1 CHAT domain-containing tetratricopeptide repeat protein [Streptomyces sp. ActVer]